MKVKIFTWNNSVGIVTDAVLVKDLLCNNLQADVEIVFITKTFFENWRQYQCDSDCVAVWIQNPIYELTPKFRKNIFFINEEWTEDWALRLLHMFDFIVCKNQFAKKLLEPYHKNVVCLPFISRNLYNPDVPRTKQYLHFNGRAIQKNTELVMQQTQNITVFDVTQRFKQTAAANIDYRYTYMTDNEVVQLLNEHSVHICPSLYESWGHYLYEGLSTGAEIVCSAIPTFTEQLDADLVHFLPVTEKIDNSYWFTSDDVNNTFLFRKSYYVDPKHIQWCLSNFEPKGTAADRRQMYSDIMNKNTKQLLDFFANIL